MAITAETYLRLRRTGHSDAEIARVLDVSIRAVRKANKRIPFDAEQVRSLMSQGKLDREIAAHFNVSINTGRRWRLAVTSGAYAAQSPRVELGERGQIKPAVAAPGTAANPFGR